MYFSTNSSTTDKTTPCTRRGAAHVSIRNVPEFVHINSRDQNVIETVKVVCMSEEVQHVMRQEGICFHCFSWPRLCITVLRVRDQPDKGLKTETERRKSFFCFLISCAVLKNLITWCSWHTENGRCSDITVHEGVHRDNPTKNTVTNFGTFPLALKIRKKE